MKKKLVPIVLGACVAVSLVMWILKPIPNGHGYEYGFQLSAALLALWSLYAAGPRLIFKKGILVFVMLCGLGLGLRSLMTTKPDPEIVRAYGSVFETLDSGKNPYTAGTIFHLTESHEPAFGNFNYPPLEIWPYYLASRIAGTWNLTVLTITLLLIQALSCFILIRMFPRIRLVYLLPFLSVFLLGEVKTNPAMTLLLTALILFFVKRESEKPRPMHRYIIAVLFGLGLLTKFMIIPLIAAYYWNQFNPRNLRSLVRIGVDVSIALATCALFMMPFGVAAVIKSTILFNLVLKDRAVLTTFFPNVLSGLFSWLGLSGLYSVAAVAALGVSVLIAPRLGRFTAMLTAAFTFLLVAPTPEPQFVPLMLFFVVAARCTISEEQGHLIPGVWKELPSERAAAAPSGFRARRWWSPEPRSGAGANQPGRPGLWARIRTRIQQD
jgi:hypothetical protein